MIEYKPVFPAAFNVFFYFQQRWDRLEASTHIKTGSSPTSSSNINGLQTLRPEFFKASYSIFQAFVLRIYQTVSLMAYANQTKTDAHYYSSSNLKGQLKVIQCFQGHGRE